MSYGSQTAKSNSPTNSISASLKKTRPRRKIWQGPYGLWPILTLLPALILITLFYIYPSVGNLVFSFTNFRGNIDLFNWVGWTNYQQLLAANAKDLLNSIGVTLAFSLGTITLGNIGGVALAVLMNMKLPFRQVYRSVLFFPSVLGVVVIGLVWTLMLDPISGPVHNVMKSLGWRSALLGDPNLAIYLLMLVQLWAFTGSTMMLYLAGLQSIPQELYDAARIDGAGGLATFFNITLPLLRPAVSINLLLGIINGVRTFDLVLVLTRGGPDKATMTLGMFMFNSLGSNSSSQGFTAAVAVVQFLIIFVLVLIAQFYLRKGERNLT